MFALRVAIVSRDPQLRLDAARAFDGAPTAWEVRLYEHEPEVADVVVFGPDAAEGDGIVFDPRHPERMLEEIAALHRRARIIVVTGGGRGVGATTVGLHLAAASARHHSTCFVDLDPTGGGVRRLGLGEATDGDGRSDDVELAAVPVPGGFRVLPPRDPPSNNGEALESTADLFDQVVVDVPDGCGSVSALESANLGVIVMTPAPTSVYRAANLLAANDRMQWASVLNRTGPGGELECHQLERILGHRIAVELPCTPALRDCEERCALFSSRFARWSRRLDDLFRALEAT